MRCIQFANACVLESYCFYIGYYFSQYFCRFSWDDNLPTM